VVKKMVPVWGGVGRVARWRKKRKGM